MLKARSSYFELQLTEGQFFLLVLSTVMIAAAGYIINDYFDIKIDKVNKPEHVVIDKGVKRRVAMGAHTVINFLAIGIALYVAFVVGFWKLAILQFICAAGLWFYSTNFKRMFLVGNFVIALFTALVPLVVGVYELLLCYKHYYPIDNTIDFTNIWRWVLGLSFFAFITTLLREMIKDMEDYEGDKEFGCYTMPIAIGIKSSKIVVVVLSLFTMACLAYLQYLQFELTDFLSVGYFAIALQLPFVFLIYKTITATHKKQFRIAGNTAKLIMLMGVSYLFIVYYLMS